MSNFQLRNCDAQREEIAWQLIAYIDNNSFAEYPSLPMGNFDFVRLYLSAAGNTNNYIEFFGAVSLPAGYEEKNGVTVAGRYELDGNSTIVLNVTGISAMNFRCDGSGKFSWIVQGIRYK